MKSKEYHYSLDLQEEIISYCVHRPPAKVFLTIYARWAVILNSECSAATGLFFFQGTRQRCSSVHKWGVKSMGLHFPNYFLLEVYITYTKWDQPGLASLTNHSDLNIAQINKRGGARLRKGREVLLQSQLQGTKTWRGKKAVGPPPNLPPLETRAHLLSSAT